LELQTKNNKVIILYLLSYFEFRFMTDNVYKFLILELGIAIVDEKNQLQSFKNFDEPVQSHLKIKNRDYVEISESLEFFKVKPVLLQTNYPDIIDYLRNNAFNAEKISAVDERQFQIDKFSFYKRIYDSNQENHPGQERNIVGDLREFSLKWSSIRVQEASEQLDLHISQSINALDEIDKILNTVGTRMREWYGLHFPELDNLLQNIVTYASIVSKVGKRDDITGDFLQGLEIPENKIEIILTTAKRSKGGKITEENLLILQSLANEVISLAQIRKTLEDHIDISMEEISPNLKELLTATVGARLIAKAGSLKRLASLSSSTIQILGAEKALFRTLKTGANPPKHGLLFQHPVIHSAPKWQRGKLARAISSKAAIAARVDLYSRNPESSNTLASKLNDRITEIQEKYKEPSEIQQKQQQQNFKRGDRDSYTRNKGKKYGRDRDRDRDGDRDFKFKKNKFKKRFHKSNKK
jgi:nucleolar protein 56